jgi:hypothetical protein
MSNEEKGKSTQRRPALKFVGCCFHIFKEDNKIQYQGTVRADLGEHYYLVGYFDWLVGEESTLEIVHISRMCGAERAVAVL